MQVSQQSITQLIWAASSWQVLQVFDLIFDSALQLDVSTHAVAIFDPVREHPSIQTSGTIPQKRSLIRHDPDTKINIQSLTIYTTTPKNLVPSVIINNTYKWNGI